MERWTGRVAVVTGASSGIGYAVANELARHGMKVAALARRYDRLQLLQQECTQHCKGILKIYQCDITDEKEIALTIKAILTDLGPISVLVNNAAIIAPMPLTDTSQGSCRKLYETNVIGLVTITQHVVETMKKHNITDGHIININSITGHMISPVPGMANYCASKNAITILTASIKNELSALKFKTRVTSISPGYVKTEMSEGFLKNHPNKKFPYLNTNDISECIIFVLSLKSNINISEMTVQPVGETIMSYISDCNMFNT
uniref:Putative dehydrogenase n=1 Tax=Triatoma dimidiata TaxID=72491 RepID=A0A0V0G817_TRIDM